jgi:excisionase family DNA binding protein
VNLKTAARRLGVHYQTAYRWVRSGQLVAVKVGAGYEISDAALARFQAQRAAIERVPDATPPRQNGRTEPGAALKVLRDMVECVSVDARALQQRAAECVAHAIGDAVAVFVIDGEALVPVAFHHANPQRAVVMGAMLRGRTGEPAFAERAVERGEPVFVPQVPQREVRALLRPEFHQYLATVGVFSAVAAPLIVDDVIVGAMSVRRDRPGRPYTTDDRDFVVAVAAKVSAGMERAARARAAWELRASLVEHALAPDDVVDHASDWLANAVPEDAVAAVVDVDGRVRATTEPFAKLLGTTVAEADGTRLETLVASADDVRETADRMLDGELDYSTIVTRPAADPAECVMLHGATVRQPDATPSGIVYVANAVRELPDS